MSGRPRRAIPHLHVRPPRRVGIGEGHQDAEMVGNCAGLLRLRGQIDRALGLEDGMASVFWNGYREVDGRRFGPMVRRATTPEQMGEPREPEPPDHSAHA